MKKQCPRCQSSFECKEGNIEECDCSKVVISKETYQFISTTYNDCLCTTCLREIEKEQQSSPKPTAVLNGSNIINN